jgi:hypothetical protein
MPRPDPPTWSFLTNHAQVLLCIAHDPGIRLREIDLLIAGEPPRQAKGFPSDQTLAPNASTRWSAGDFVRSPDGPPTRDDIEVTALKWEWLAGQHAACPTGSPG